VQHATEESELPLPRVLLDSPAFLMIQLLRVFRRMAEQSVKGPRMPQFTVLACLAEFGPASQREIARRLRLDPSDLVPIVDRLEHDGLALREKDPADRRRHALVLTDEGRSWHDEMVRMVAARRSTIMPTLSEDERDELTRLLRTCLAGLDPRAALSVE
jgi:DNA-binding MarR family transcriptional regulator